MNFKKNTKPKDFNKKRRKWDSTECLFAFFEVGEKILIAFKYGTFPLLTIGGTGLKILSPLQMLQRFSIPIAKVKVGNIYESWLNEICQKIYLFI